MTQENKNLLLRDLCGRLPYWVKVKVRYYYEYEDGTFKKYNEIKYFDAEILDLLISGDRSLDDIKPYLRPMSSMTEEEKEELLNHVLGGEGVEYFHIAHDGSIDGNQEAEQDLYNLNLHWLNFGPLTTSSYIDWLNKKMFDYRGLIPKGRAISTDEFNPYKD